MMQITGLSHLFKWENLHKRERRQERGDRREETGESRQERVDRRVEPGIEQGSPFLSV
jgi:hypothetical protein